MMLAKCSDKVMSSIGLNDIKYNSSLPGFDTSAPSRDYDWHKTLYDLCINCYKIPIRFALFWHKLHRLSCNTLLHCCRFTLSVKLLTASLKYLYLYNMYSFIHLLHRENSFDLLHFKILWYFGLGDILVADAICIVFAYSQVLAYMCTYILNEAQGIGFRKTCYDSLIGKSFSCKHSNLGKYSITMCHH